MQKLFCYVDETGQDTAGTLFVVSVIVVQQDRQELSDLLEAMEAETGKKKTKWIRTKRAFRLAYIERVLRSGRFQGKILYSISEGTKAYREATLMAVAAAIGIAR